MHAAGLYNEAHTDCIFDYVVSSYIPTVSCVVERTSVSHTTEQADKVLVIGQPNAPGLPPLPGTKKELKVIQEKFSTANIPFLSLEGDPATIDRTMKELELHSCIHFACHAVQDASHPLKSGFYMSDGRLELWKVLQIQNHVADFAFLSACQTSKGEEGLSEEVIHLAAGLLAAGYRGVVATMWSIEDRYGLKVADDFYTDLISRRGRMREARVGLVGSIGAAHALHYSIQCLRKELGDSPSALLAWVPYVHVGV
jgi:CHAT domain-containing protein